MKNKDFTVKKNTYSYQPMDFLQRKEILPKRNICSLYPADDWADALNAGNGIQYLEIKGDPYHEFLGFSHEKLYEPCWAETPAPPNLADSMMEIRALLMEGKNKEAMNVIDKEQRKQGYDKFLNESSDATVWPLSPLKKHKALILELMQEIPQKPYNYLRWLDMMSGECVVQWDTDAGRWQRKSLVSFEDNVIVQKIVAPKRETIKMKVKVNLPMLQEDLSEGFNPAENFREDYLRNPELCEFQIKGTNDIISVSCAYYPEYGKKGYVSSTRIISYGGNVITEGSEVRINDSREVYLLTRTEKYEEDFSVENIKIVEEALEKYVVDYENLREKNKNYMESRMGISQLKLCDEETGEWALTTEELLCQQHTCYDFSKPLMEKLYDAGRFFLVTDTGMLPPAWGHHNINTNLQVCAGNITGLHEEMETYFRFFENKFEDFRTNAKRLFGARGVLASVHCDYDSGLIYHFSKDFPHFCWCGCLGWIYNEFWGKYLITGDKEFLRERIIPGLKEIALFFEDYAKERDKDGKLLFYPGFSPENPSSMILSYEDVFPLNINAVMDIMIYYEVLDNLIQGCKELGIEEDMIPHWQTQKERLPEYLLDEEGGLKEWAWADSKENYNHRHVSHHYGVWPGHFITFDSAPELAKAILISNRKRGQENDSAHGIIHRLFTAIRLKDVNDTLYNLKQLMEHGFLTRSLYTYHFPYYLKCPDLLGAMPCILAEMIVYSRPGMIELFPAFPDSFQKGEINGIWLYTFAKIECLKWNREEKWIHLELSAYQDQEICLKVPENISSLKMDDQERMAIGKSTKISICKGQTMQIQIFLDE